MSFLEKVPSSTWKKLALQIGQALILFLPIAQLTDVDFVIEQLGKFGVKGMIASVVAAYIVAWIKRSPLTKKEIEVLEQKPLPKGAVVTEDKKEDE
jgi:hypothetical protein